VSHSPHRVFESGGYQPTSTPTSPSNGVIYGAACASDHSADELGEIDADAEYATIDDRPLTSDEQIYATIESRRVSVAADVQYGAVPRAVDTDSSHRNMDHNGEGADNDVYAVPTSLIVSDDTHSIAHQQPSGRLPSTTTAPQPGDEPRSAAPVQEVTTSPPPGKRKKSGMLSVRRKHVDNCTVPHTTSTNRSLSISGPIAITTGPNLARYQSLKNTDAQHSPLEISASTGTPTGVASLEQVQTTDTQFPPARLPPQPPSSSSPRSPPVAPRSRKPSSVATSTSTMLNVGESAAPGSPNPDLHSIALHYNAVSAALTRVQAATTPVSSPRVQPKLQESAAVSDGVATVTGDVAGPAIRVPVSPPIRRPRKSSASAEASRLPHAMPDSIATSSTRPPKAPIPPIAAHTRSQRESLMQSPPPSRKPPVPPAVQPRSIIRDKAPSQSAPTHARRMRPDTSKIRQRSVLAKRKQPALVKQ
jgi:hypothetical protein